MRILHVNKFLYRRGGAEAYMADVAALQQAAGHEVTFFGMRHPENPPLPLDRYFPAEVEFNPAPAGVVGKLGAAGRMLWSPSARRGMEEVLAAFQPHVVHLHNIYHQLSPSVLHPLANGRSAVVMTLHDYKLACPTYLFLDKGQLCTACLGGRFHHAVLRRCASGSLVASAMAAVELSLHTLTGAYASVQRFLCPSAFLASKMREGGVFPDRMRVLHNFVDTTGVEAKRNPGGPLVSVGRLSSEKAVDVLIQAIGLLPDHVRLEIAGEGPERARLEQLADEIAHGRVVFHGRIPREQVLALMRSAAAVVLPSRCHENQPLAVLEAFACGVPVVSTDLGGLPELVRPGETGDLVPVNDSAALASAITKVLTNPDEALAMGRRARLLVEEQFSPAGHLAALDAHYAALLEGVRDRGAALVGRGGSPLEGGR